MTAPSVISVTQIQSSASSGSQSVTVPAGCNAVLLMAAFWRDPATDISTATLGGSSFSAVNKTTSSSNGLTTTWRLNNPSTGSQTFAWSWAATPLGEGADIFLVWLQDVDTSGDPVRGSAATTGSSGIVTVTSGSFSSDTNDLCVCVGYSYGTTDCDAAPSGAGQTEVADSTEFNSCQGAVGTKAGVSGTTTMKVYGNYPSIVAVSVKGASGPAGLSIPVAIYHLQQQGIA